MKKDNPALERSEDLIKKVSRMGFQWANIEGPVAKIEEELRELKAELAEAGKLSELTKNTCENIPSDLRARIKSELGDLLFTIANLGYFFDLSPEQSLHQMLDRFEARFRFVEAAVAASGKKMEEHSLQELDQYWNKAKKITP